MSSLISVIIPVYKVNKTYLEACFNSLLKQTYTDLEIIVIDDGSKDESSEICDGYALKDKRIKVIHKENEGVSAARNDGIDLAHGEYIAFVDSDDYLSDDYFAKLYASLIATQSDIVCGGHTKVFPNYREKHQAFDFTYKFNMDVIGTVWGKLYRRTTIDSHRFNIELSRCEDIEFNLRIFKDARYHYCDEYDYYYRINETSAVHQFDPEAMNKYLKTINVLNKECTSEELKQVYYVITCTILRVLVDTYIMRLDESLFKKSKLIKDLCKQSLFKEALNKVDLSKFSFTRRLPIIALKYHLSYFVIFIIYIRERQVKK